MRKTLHAAAALALAALIATPAYGHESEGTTHDMTTAAAPTISVTVAVDMMSGYNVTVDTTRFRWSPEHASSMHVNGEGHAHVYVDDTKIMRLYTPAFHLNTDKLGLEPGEHALRIALNGNDHVPYSADGKVVESELRFTVAEPKPAQTMTPPPHDVDTGGPTVSVSVDADPMSGFNVALTTTSFRWAPEHASSMHVAGEGHAHLYVDGVKVARVYGPAFHLDPAKLKLAAGTHTVTVDLNGNDHGPYRVAGAKVEASAQFTTVEDNDPEEPVTPKETKAAGDGPTVTPAGDETTGTSTSVALGALVAAVAFSAGAFLLARRRAR